MEQECTSFKGWCCACVVGLLLLLLLLDYIRHTGALTRADHRLVGAALVCDEVALICQHCIRIGAITTPLVLGCEPRN